MPCGIIQINFVDWLIYNFASLPEQL